MRGLIADSYLLHPLKGLGYQFWSGVEGAAQQGIAWVLTIGLASWAWYHRHNCHVDGCRWLGHPVEGTSYVACKAHHPHRQGEVTAERIARAAQFGHNAPD